MPLWIGAVLMVGGLLSLAVHPSLPGFVIVYRLMAGLGLIWALAQFSKDEFIKYLALPVMIVAGLEGLMAIAQLLTERALLPEWTGAASPVTTDGLAQAAGTLGTANELATLGLLGVALGIAAYHTVPRRRRRWWPVPIALAAVPVAVSFSWAALIGLIAIVAALLWGMSREIGNWGTVLAALGVGLIVPAVVFAGSWVSRVDQTIGGAEESGFNARAEQLEQAWSLIESDWKIGVGPGRYSAALESPIGTDPSLAPFTVYNVPLYFAAEDGAIVGGLVVLMALALAVLSLRRSTENRALFLAPIPFLIFDHFLYTSPAGLLMLSLWLGGLAALESRPEL